MQINYDNEWDSIESRVRHFFERELSLIFPDSYIRHQQITMGLQVARTLYDLGICAVEAKVGTGKTFAYLVPAIIHSIRVKKPVIIATSTNTLQDQIGRDFPKFNKIWPNVKFAILKGRTNYACLKKINSLADSNLKQMIMSLIEKSSTGDKHELKSDYQIDDYWDKIKVDASKCRHCSIRTNNNCPYFKHRNQIKMMESPGIIITNQPQLLSDLKKMFISGNFSLFPVKVGGVIIDEAHNLEDNAVTPLGMNLSKQYIQNLVSNLTALRPEIKADAKAIEKSAQYTFKILTNLVRHQESESSRIKIPSNSDFTEAFNYLLENLVELNEKFYRHTGGNNELNELINNIKNLHHKDWVHWVELDKKTDSSIIGVKKTLSFEIGTLFKMLKSKSIPLVFTSATISQLGNFSTFLDSIGLTDEIVITRELDSPFQLEKQVRFFVPTNNLINRPPKRNELIDLQESLYYEQSNEIIVNLIDITRGRTLILFTSKKHLTCAYNDLKQQLTIYGSVFNQLEKDYTEEFKSDEQSILFGAGTCWEGIDIKGRSLSQVIIVRLPFPADDPYLEIKRRHFFNDDFELWFNQFLFPSMILNLKQGIGRLIRDIADYGIVSILDSRINSYKARKIFEALALDSVTIEEQRSFYKQIENNGLDLLPVTFKPEHVLMPLKYDRTQMVLHDSKSIAGLQVRMNKEPEKTMPNSNQIEYYIQLYLKYKSVKYELLKEAVSKKPLWRVYREVLVLKRILKEEKGYRKFKDFPWSSKHEKEMILDYISWSKKINKVG